ncbi:alpha/beta hydrolase-fold protein [uncultured Polaribacter sp.]|uniref:alpha/beta hydrolase n=1 Tax=uncultured Polaribacter sp. TaxID=174711 RepID=UPI002604AFC8|nr:alpha/beta hydrolase-fold protein [uncultured Polaribacter sp.]
MTTKIFILIFFIGLITVNSQTINKDKLTIGEQLKIHSNILDETRLLNIYLPSSYNTSSTKQYPVIYLLDGSLNEDFIHISGLVQFCSFSWINIIPESIVVGISNIDRKRDFTFPSKHELDMIEFSTSGGSERFIDFIENELKPIIEDTYRTSATSTIIGQSLGGLLLTEVVFKKPDLFDNYIIVSPSLWWDNESLLKVELCDSLNEKKVYIAVGKEGAVMEKLAYSLYSKLLNYQIKTPSLDVSFKYFENQNHGDTLHLAVYDAFETFNKK